MSPRIDGVELHGHLCQLEGALGLFEIAKDAGMNEMLDVVHLDEAAVAGREARTFSDRVAKDGHSTMPAFRVEPCHKVLSAKPAIVHIERDVRLACKPNQTFGRQLHVQRGGDPPDDALLCFEPVGEAETEAFAPDEGA